MTRSVESWHHQIQCSRHTNKRNQVHIFPSFSHDGSTINESDVMIPKYNNDVNISKHTQGHIDVLCFDVLCSSIQCKTYHMLNNTVEKKRDVTVSV